LRTLTESASCPPYSQGERYIISRRRAEGHSYADIAAELNRDFVNYNKGCRTGEGIKTWYRSRTMLRQLSLKVGGIDAARDAGLDVSNEVLATWLDERIEKEVQQAVHQAAGTAKARATP